jgi:triphosphoribosyl-dephospho-CoA synthetase
MIYRRMAQQQAEREAKEFGDAIEQAGRRAAQAMNPPQPLAPQRTTRCYTVGGLTNCQTY